MIFRSQYDENKERFYSNSGSPVVIKYEPKYNKNGDFELVEVGKDNIYDFIQSFKDSVDINLIVKRFANGDFSALGEEGFYGDFSNTPGNLLDYINLVDSYRRQFDELPSEIRENFGNSFERFAASAGSPEFYESLKGKQTAAPSTEQAAASPTPENVEVSMES